MGRRDFYQEERIKKYVYVFSITLVLSIVVFLTIFVMYNKKIKKEANIALENLETIEDIVSNDNLTETSISSDLTAKDMTNSTKQNKVDSKSVNNNAKVKKVDKTPVKSTVTNSIKNTIDNSVTNSTENNVTGDVLKLENSKNEELNFEAPVSGEIIKDFAIDNLIYSNTLEEWTTHSGIDIKSEKTSIVIASEKGVVESIKNDPRYGLTITISHENGFKTIYSNLLTAEFVNENEEVEKGQTIGTIGQTASFEVADEPHLHFEMYKDGEPVNPTIYFK